MARITVHKGTLAGDMKTYDMAPEMKLDAVRAQLVADGFLALDTGTVKYRFILAPSTSSNYEDVVCPLGLEHTTMLIDTLRAGSQLIVTNISKIKDVDFVGIGTNQFFNRYLGVSVWLNNRDAAAVQTNASNKAFPPLMLTNVNPTNPQAFGLYDNVCVVVENSVVGFTLSSWGAVGFNYYIGADSGDPIVDSALYVSFGESPNRFAQSDIYRYYNKEQTIQIVGADQVGIVGKDNILRFQKVTFRSRRMTYYKRGDGQEFESNQMPPPLVPHGLRPMAGFGKMAKAEDIPIERQIATAGQIGTVPGDFIKPGGPVAGPPSQQQWGGTIYDARTDDWSQALGEIVVYFFVFKTWEQANQVITGYNAPDPTMWG